MNKHFFFLIAWTIGIFTGCQKSTETDIYQLKKVITVKGRQGIAIDESFYYVSCSKALYKYDKEGNLLMANLDPFKDFEEEVNHFGDIDIYNNEIYTGVEYFIDGRGTNIQIAVYDAETLTFKRSLPWNPESGQVEVSGIAVDSENKLIWLSDWVDSRFVYAYSLETGAYHTKMQCRPMPFWCQGIVVKDGKMLFSADDGDADYHIVDCIYVADISHIPSYDNLQTEAIGTQAGSLSLFREMHDFKRAGEIEGISIDPTNDDLVVLNNRGVRIILGMPTGPYSEEGYTEEIHELYIYEKRR